MRIALVSPYSWTYEGGVNRHVQALAEQLLTRGHYVRVLAPWDPPDRLSKALHRAPANLRQRPDYLIPLGRTAGVNANGAVSNLSVFPDSVNRLREELDKGEFDVVHVHEPPAPVVSWDACSFDGAPVVGTFHAYSTKPIPNHLASLLGARRKFNQLSERIAVSEAAAWTGKRWFGGAYTVIPNGVDVDGPTTAPKTEADHLRVAFVGRPEERKGLPVLLRAFEALADQIPCRLTLVGPTDDDVQRHIDDPEVLSLIDARGRIASDNLWDVLHEADVLCAPSLSGESFGMVLTEAFAAGTPVIASDIAGYNDVVSDGVDGVLVPPADPQRLAEELQAAYLYPDRRKRMGKAARESAQRYSWGSVAHQVEAVYERVVAEHESDPSAARSLGVIPIDGSDRRPARKLASIDPQPADQGSGGLGKGARMGLAALFGLGLTALAASKVGFDDQIGLQAVSDTIFRSDLAWVLAATAMMIASLFLRAGSWYVTLKSALPTAPIRRRDVTSATMIGIVMSATLPARVGEPARAMVVSRRIGRVRDRFGTVLGTLVSQTVLNLIALAILGVIIISTTELFSSNSERLFFASAMPAVLLIAVLAAPAFRRARGTGRIARAMAVVGNALGDVREGLRIFLDIRRGPIAAVAQIGAWGLQLLSVYLLAVALGLESQIGIGGAAAVLFAVNVTAVIPVTPSNVGVFQFATASVLVSFGLDWNTGIAFGVILQAVEFATAVGLGLPALVREGMTWSDMRVRALSAAPVELPPLPEAAGAGTRDGIAG